MHRCLQLAELGRANVSPNPMVGCVIVHNNEIIGEGYHKKYGEVHAEVNAINSVKNQDLLSEACLYVNLEPCSHYGKTPPCSDLIISKNIKKVVVSALDPNPLVAGRGIEKMREAGIDVKLGVLEKESIELNSRFYTFHHKKRPYVILKWAQTADGFIDKHRKIGDGQKPEWITNDYCKTLVHKWRTEEDAFLVGTYTVLLDNPQLTARLWYGKNPLRIAIDYNSALNKQYNIFDDSAPSLVFANNERNDLGDIEIIDLDNNLAEQILEKLHKRKIQSLVVEGGRQTLDLFIKSNLWDEARVFQSDRHFGDGVKAPDFNYKLETKQFFGNTSLKFYRNRTNNE
ncbi:MAG: bifunctional diaminohydroxyphosphoribosylaminopyrimidine deaminase/5-amino-6-(5-phosphoribosylamino)uracil reductase RibD [Bacteroidales bacterium]|nr:bifunctional diaminohydroxyphosphoribosylaminopyrimidine deaminase/5-amino-6-(5-phosphoribosylamino)uracil reductase RibD [Bacteroidales bacterium]